MAFFALTVCDGGLHLLPHSELERADVFGHINQSSRDIHWILNGALHPGTETEKLRFI